MAGKSNCTFTNEQVQEALAEHGTKKKAAEALGVSVTSFHRWVHNGVPTGDKLARRVREDATEQGGLTLDKLLRQHHPVERFLSVVDTIPKGEFHVDMDMQRLCEFSQQAWSRLKRNERVQDYKVRLPDGSFVWGSKPDAALLRRKLMEV